MELLKGKSILIGKESGQGRLLASISINGKISTAFIGQPGSVPACVSRCNPETGAAHCRIDIDQLGNSKLTNLKEQNVTYVNGIEIETKTIKPDSIIAMGKDCFSIKAATIFNAIRQATQNNTSITRPTQNCYSIIHLKEVWETYEKRLEEIQRTQIITNRRRILPMMIGMLGSIAAPVLALTSKEINTLYVTIPISVIAFLIYFMNYTAKDTSIEDKKEANDKFMDNYVCPNPDCNTFMGNQPYKLLRQKKKCPNCGAVLKG